MRLDVLRQSLHWCALRVHFLVGHMFGWLLLYDLFLSSQLRKLFPLLHTCLYLKENITPNYCMKTILSHDMLGENFPRRVCTTVASQTCTVLSLASDRRLVKHNTNLDVGNHRLALNI